jgi:hypothetical protein
VAHCDGEEERPRVIKRLEDGTGLSWLKTQKGLSIVKIDYSAHFGYAPGNSENYFYEPGLAIEITIIPCFYMLLQSKNLFFEQVFLLAHWSGSSI